MPSTSTLPRRFYRRDAPDLARALLGRRLVRVLDTGQRLAGRIVEVEAYLGVEDRAAHSFGGRRTPRNEAMYLDAGHAYVYFTYGMHWCFNVVAGRPDLPVACLIRAIEPLEGLDLMRLHRAAKRPRLTLRDTDLCSGPAKLCQALAIDRSLNAIDLTADRRLFIENDSPARPDRIAAAPRVGVDYAGDWADKPLRFLLRENPHVSRP